MVDSEPTSQSTPYCETRMQLVEGRLDGIRAVSCTPLLAMSASRRMGVGGQASPDHLAKGVRLL